MKSSSLQKRNGYFIIGAIGLVLSAGYMGMSLQFPLGTMDLPGAAVFPITVAVIAILASLATILEGWKMDKAVQLDLPDVSKLKHLLIMVGLLIGYVIVLPWLGQLITSTLFCVLLLRVLSDYPWPRILLYSLMISVSLYVVFIIVLKVPMPKSVLIYF